MTHNWFDCKLRYDKTLENGIQAKVTESYYVDALSYTEAEARIIEEITPYINGEFEIVSIVKKKINEVFFNEDGDYWYIAKVNFITLDEKCGMEKRTACRILIQARDFDDAHKRLVKGMLGTLADYEIASISDSMIIDLYPYVSEGMSNVTDVEIQKNYDLDNDDK